MWKCPLNAEEEMVKGADYEAPFRKCPILLKLTDGKRCGLNNPRLCEGCDGKNVPEKMRIFKGVTALGYVKRPLLAVHDKKNVDEMALIAKEYAGEEILVFHVIDAVATGKLTEEQAVGILEKAGVEIDDEDSGTIKDGGDSIQGESTKA